MSTLIRSGGSLTNKNSWAKRATFTRSDGSFVTVLVDVNDATSSGGDGSGDTKIYVYSSTDRSSFTLRTTITPSSPALGESNVLYAADLFDDNSLAIIYVTAPGGLYYVKVDGTTWSASSPVQIASSMGDGTYDALDVSVSEGGAVLVAAAYQRTAAGDRYGCRLFCRRTTPGTWAQVHEATIYPNNPAINKTPDITCTWVRGGTSTARQLAFAISGTKTNDDLGGRLYTGILNEASGSAVSSIVLQKTYGQGVIPSGSIGWSEVQPPRQMMLWSNQTNHFVLGIVTSYNVLRVTAIDWELFGPDWREGAGIINRNVADGASTSNGVAMTFGRNVVTFAYYGIRPGTSLPAMMAVPVYLSATFDINLAVLDSLNALEMRRPMGGGGHNDSYSNMDIVGIKNLSDTNRRWHLVSLEAPPVPAEVLPSSGSNVFTGTPVVVARARIGSVGTYPQYPISLYRAQWQVATDAGFTTNVKNLEEEINDSVTLVNPSNPNFLAVMQQEWPLANALAKGTWYIRARTVNQWNLASAWTSATTFIIGHPPTVGLMAPANDSVLVYGPGDVTFNWEFNDPFPGDSQSAFQIIVERVETGEAVYDSNKVTSTASQHTATIDDDWKDMLLRWKVRLWDSEDTGGDYGEWATFLLTDPPTVDVTAPADGGTVDTALPTVTFDVDISTTRNAQRYRVLFTKGIALLWDSNWKSIGLTGSMTINYTIPKIVLANNESYTVTVIVQDDWGLEGTDYSGFVTEWSPPDSADGVLVDMGSFNTEGQGFIEVSWDDTAVDDDFVSWAIYRKDDLIDPLDNSVIKEGRMTLLKEVFESQSLYIYDDYYAPGSYKVTYWVAQRADRFGSIVESEDLSQAVVVYPKTEGYWLVDPAAVEAGEGAFMFSIVTADTGTMAEYEEETFNIIGKGRHVDRGERLGISGTLTVQLRENGPTSARSKKLRLEKMKEDNREVFLRTPFGDIYWVYCSNMGFTRIAGVGQSEAMDVTIPYIEVGV